MHCFNIETAVADVGTPIPTMSLATGISIQPLFDQYIEPDFVKICFVYFSRCHVNKRFRLAIYLQVLQHSTLL